MGGVDLWQNDYEHDDDDNFSIQTMHDKTLEAIIFQWHIASKAPVLSTNLWLPILWRDMTQLADIEQYIAQTFKKKLCLSFLCDVGLLWS